MCKRSCCPPQGGSGPSAIIAIIIGLIVVPIVLRLLVEVLKLIELIMLTIAGTAVLGLISWAAIAWHRRTTAAAPPPAQIMIIPVDPATGLPTTTAHRRALTGTGQHAARRPAITASLHHPADAGELTRTRRGPRT